MHDKYALHFVVYVARIDQGLDNRIVRRLAKKIGVLHCNSDEWMQQKYVQWKIPVTDKRQH